MFPIFSGDGLTPIERNVTFEPVLSDGDAVARATKKASEAVAAGLPILISSHSTNYISRFIDRAAESCMLHSPKSAEIVARHSRLPA